MRSQRENSGILFRNSRKRETNHADYQGAINVKGEEFWLNGWIKEGENGKFLSLSVRPKQQNQERLKVVGGTDNIDPDDEIPF